MSSSIAVTPVRGLRTAVSERIPAERRGIEQFTGQLMDLEERPARRVPGCKLLSLVHAIVVSDGPWLSLAERGRQGIARQAEW